MDEIRCGNCHRKLGEGEYTRLAIKCPRCGHINQLSAMRATPERRRASTVNTSHDGLSLPNSKTHRAVDRR
jgi:phage FluMu protein Com